MLDQNNHPIGRYFYDGEGRRVKKVTDLETTVFVYDAGGKLIAEYSNQTPENPNTSYVATDTLLSIRLVTDRNGNVVSRRDFQPFGEELTADGSARKSADKYSTPTEDKVRQRFTGYQKDIETGLDFAEARMYENRHGRFTAVDPLLASGKSANPQTFNRFVYCRSRPVDFADPDGRQSGRKPDDTIRVTAETNKDAPRIYDDGKRKVKVNYIDKDSYGTAVPIGGKFSITYTYLVNKPPDGVDPASLGHIEALKGAVLTNDGKTQVRDMIEMKSGGTFATSEKLELVDSTATVTGAANEAFLVTKTETFRVNDRPDMRPGTGSIGFRIVVTDPVIAPRTPEEQETADRNAIELKKPPKGQNESRPNPAVWTKVDHDDRRIEIRKEGVRRNE